MMWKWIYRLLYGRSPPPRSPVEGIPTENRDAHHRLNNTAMKMKRISKELDSDAHDILEMLARDIRRTGNNGC